MITYPQNFHKIVVTAISNDRMHIKMILFRQYTLAFNF